jgi:transcriptional regulator with XRE-family HTH domain
VTSPAAGHGSRPAAVRALPIRPRPAAGDTPATYIRRLARANHLRPAYLNRYLRDDATGQPSIDMLAALAARPASSLMHAFSQEAPARRRYFTGSRRQELFEDIRRDAGTSHRSIRALADDYGLHRRVIRQALASQPPRPRKPSRPSGPRPSRLAPYTVIIDAILDEDLRDPRRPARTFRQILDHLITEHNATGISYAMVARYAGGQRSLRPRPHQPAAASPDTAGIRPAHQAAWSPGHQAIEQHDLLKLRKLLDAGNDAEDETADGLTLLRHAIHREHTAHVEHGGPLNVGMTVLLLARGADPHHLRDGTSIETEAEILGHWLAAEVLRAWKPANPDRSPGPQWADFSETRGPMGRNQ